MNISLAKPLLSNLHEEKRKNERKIGGKSWPVLPARLDDLFSWIRLIYRRESCLTSEDERSEINCEADNGRGRRRKRKCKISDRIAKLKRPE